MYNDVVFHVRFRYQLAMFDVYILIGLSRLLVTHIAYEIAIYKITTGNWLDVGKRSLMQRCSETLFKTVIIVIPMVVEKVKTLGIAEKF